MSAALFHVVIPSFFSSFPSVFRCPRSLLFSKLLLAVQGFRGLFFNLATIPRYRRDSLRTGHPQHGQGQVFEGGAGAEVDLAMRPINHPAVPDPP